MSDESRAFGHRYSKRTAAEAPQMSASAKRITKWLEDGCPSYGVPEADIRKLLRAYIAGEVVQNA